MYYCVDTARFATCEQVEPFSFRMCQHVRDINIGSQIFFVVFFFFFVELIWIVRYFSTENTFFMTEFFYSNEVFDISLTLKLKDMTNWTLNNLLVSDLIFISMKTVWNLTYLSLYICYINQRNVWQIHVHSCIILKSDAKTALDATRVCEIAINTK